MYGRAYPGVFSHVLRLRISGNRTFDGSAYGDLMLSGIIPGLFGSYMYGGTA